jgi:hypothetical protein
MVYLLINVDSKMSCTVFGEIPKQWDKASGRRIPDIVPQRLGRLASNGAAGDHVALFYMRVERT